MIPAPCLLKQKAPGPGYMCKTIKVFFEERVVMDRGETEVMREYLEAVGKRFEEDADAYRKFAQFRSIAGAGSHHLARFDLAERRLGLAKASSDRISREYEHEVMNILLYEALDHVFMAFSRLDLDALGLRMPEVGQGLTGEYASEVLSILEILEALGAEILEREKRCGLNLDFSHSYREKEGITYNTQRHWGNGDPREYFTQARSLISDMLRKKLAFRSGQTTADFLRHRGYKRLLESLTRLDLAAVAGRSSEGRRAA